MGALHRRIEVATRVTGREASEARAVVEDDFHHFRVVVRQAGGRVTEALAEAVRYPLSLCPAAGLRLGEIVGMALHPASAAVMEVTDARQQCTHQIDLAGLAVAALARRLPHRVYEATVPDRVDERTTATLRRDGELVLSWDLDGPTITGPAPYAGRDIGSGFTRFARSLSLDEGEAALVLRRAVFISGGRRLVDLGDVEPSMRPLGGCWVWQPERIDQAQRTWSKQDFTGRHEALTAEDQAWLAFRS